MSKLYLVKWTGPYSFEQACEQDHNGVYLVFGRLRLGRAPAEPRPLYAGKAFRAGGVGARLREHAPREFHHPDNSWWLGQILTPAEHSDGDVRAVESMIIFGVGPMCNNRGLYHPPRQASTVISYWYGVNGARRDRNIDAMKHVPDVLTWDGEEWRVADRLSRPAWMRD